MKKLIYILCLSLGLSACSSKGSLSDIVENVLDENQGVSIDITPQKELD
jgi:hypothetical protein